MPVHASSVRPIPSPHVFTFPEGHQLLLALSCFQNLLSLIYAESEAHAASVAGVVVVGTAIAVDITETGRVATIRRTQPPVVGRYSR